MTVVVGVDHSPGSTRALEFAVIEARLRDVDLRIVHATEAWSPSPYSGHPKPSSYAERADEGRKLLARCRERAHEALSPGRVHTQVQEGSAAKILIEESRDATMVVVGSREHGELRAVFLGSVGAAVAAHAHGPVVVVRGEPRDPDSEPGGEHRIVCGTDGSAHSDASIRFAFEEAALRRRHLDVVHVWRAYDFLTPRELEQLSRDADEPLRRDVGDKAAAWPSVRYRTVVVPGRPSAELVRRTAEAELMVVGHRGSGAPLAEMLLGSVSQNVLHHAGCPVAVVREQRGRH